MTTNNENSNGNSFDQADAQKTGRQYKDTLFRTLFSEQKRFIELYNAISGNFLPEDSVITPCPPNQILSYFNDLAYLVESRLIVMCEHQSSVNMNMPLRFLLYLSDTLRTYMLKPEMLYSRSVVNIPKPEFYMLYNGKEKMNYSELRLSDSFLTKDNNE